jgi:hypothetical protein
MNMGYPVIRPKRKIARHRSRKGRIVGRADRGRHRFLADSGPVKNSAGNVALEGGSKLGSFSTIAGESVAINTTGDLSVAGGTGLGAFGLLSSYRDINLTVGGTVRLDSGSGLGSFARVQTLDPGSTIDRILHRHSAGKAWPDVDRHLRGVRRGTKPHSEWVATGGAVHRPS